MQVTVKFTSYSSLAGTSACMLELPDGATVADLAGLLAERFPGLFPQAERAIYLVNQRTGARDTRLADGSEVLLLQVLGGG